MRESKCKTFHAGADFQALVNWMDKKVETDQSKSLTSKYVVIVTRVEEDPRFITQVFKGLS